jgi:hypothetical protein
MDLYFAEHGVRPGSAASRGSGVLSEGVAATLQAAAMMAQLAEAGDRDSDEMQRLRTTAQRMLTSLLESDPSVQGTPPASDEAIAALERVNVAPRSADDKDMPSCAVCTEQYEVNEPARKMPCGHVFHGDCVVPWLRNHCTCPMCRHEIGSNSPAYEHEKQHRQRQNAVDSLRSSMYN